MNETEPDTPVRLTEEIVVTLRVYKFLRAEGLDNIRMQAFMRRLNRFGLNLVETNPVNVEFRKERIDRLEFGNQQFGHTGTHTGIGTDDCPRRLHHHCDMFCEMPTIDEIIMAGLDPKTFRAKSRR